MNDATVKRNIRLLNAFTICVNTVFLLPIILPFYKTLGLTFHDLLIGESVFAAGLILFDVPTGWLADHWGRKKTMAAGASWYVLCLYMLMTATGFWETIVAQGMISLAICLISGANSAFLYDTLLAAGRADEFRKREGFRFGLQLYACSFACIAGAYLYTFSPSLPFQVEMIMMTLGVVFALMLQEPKRHKRIIQHHPLKDMKDTMVYVLAGHRDIAVIIFLMTLLFSTTKICMWSLQAYTTVLSFPESWNGWIIASVMLLGAISGHFSHHIFPKLSGRHTLYAMLGLLAFAMAAAGYLLSPIGLILIGLEGFAYGFAAPRIQESLNQMADSGRRATILSTANLTTSVGFIPFAQIIGSVTDHSGIGTALITHAILLMGLGLLAALLIERKRA